MNLPLNIKHSIETLKNNYLYCNKLNTTTNDDGHAKQLKSTLEVPINTNNNIPDPLDSALLDMCKHLEVYYYNYITITNANTNNIRMRISSSIKLSKHYKKIYNYHKENHHYQN